VLVIWNNGQPLEWEDGIPPQVFDPQPDRQVITPRTIGELRNEAARWALDGPTPHPDIFVHFDDDDHSHSSRVAEQIALLQASGKQCVGYRNVLFWREHARTSHPCGSGEAWLYSNNDPRKSIGSSLCYWRETWEKRPFSAQPRPGKMEGEDVAFLRDRDTVGVSSIDAMQTVGGVIMRTVVDPGAPRMICSIHGGNSSDQYTNLERSSNWKRVSEWDALCRKTMQL
jgi:hypothetical protein